MSTLLYVFGWRFFLYSDEHNKTYIQCQNREKMVKFLIVSDSYALDVVESEHMEAKEYQAVEKIISQYYPNLI